MLTLPAPRQSHLWCPSLSGSSCSSSGSECTADSPSLDEDPPFEVPVPDAPPVKKIRNVRKSNIHKCTVCGDKPTGYHYDVLSCNGCKTFFRRTVIHQRRFSCARGGACEFTKDFRCACRACRFDKCVKAGMNPKAIQFPTNATEKFEDTDEVMEDMDKALVLQSTTVTNNEDLQYMLALDMMIHRENAVQSLRSSQFPVFPAESLLQILRQPGILGKLAFTEGAVDNEQIRTYRMTPLKFWMVADLFLSVEFAKSFKVFQEMNKHDQQRMLANVAAPLQISTQSYYSTSAGLTFPDGIEALRYQMVVMKRYEHEDFYRGMYCRPVEIMRRLQLTQHEFALFKAVILFAPDISDLSEEARAAILAHRQRHAKVLRKHLLKEYGVVKGTEKFGDCLIAIASFVSVGEKRRNYLHVCEVTEKVRLTKIGQAIYLKRFDLDV